MLSSVIAILGVLQIAVGLLAYGAAASAIHEILGAILFGAGIICIALAGIIERLDKAVTNSDSLREMKRAADRLDEIARRLAQPKPPA